jgi:hypothetical protein
VVLDPFVLFSGLDELFLALVEFTDYMLWASFVSFTFETDEFFTAFDVELSLVLFTFISFLLLSEVITGEDF